ncbi:MAG: CoA-binding protein, partial [Candidatus Marinimicrobia bacterium]|nr:CoA-binding protein [Candidatus Neomarinimicrobiota bacterium]
MRCYPDLESIDETIDIVNIFRRSEYVSDIVKSAILIESKVIWMQDSIFHEESAKNAKKAGMLVVMNNCMLRQHKQINLL